MVTKQIILHKNQQLSMVNGPGNKMWTWLFTLGQSQIYTVYLYLVCYKSTYSLQHIRVFSLNYFTTVFLWLIGITFFGFENRILTVLDFTSIYPVCVKSYHCNRGDWWNLLFFQLKTGTNICPCFKKDQSFGLKNRLD